MVLRSGNSTHQDLLSNANSALSAGSRLGEVQFSHSTFTYFLYKTILQCEEQLNAQAAHSAMPAA